MRLLGASYSQIKEKIKVSKSSLSLWLEKYPLSEARLGQLRNLNEIRIEKCRNTKQLNRQKRLDETYKNVKIGLSNFTKKEMLIAGLFLYWGEGTKVSRSTIQLTNTDPSMLKFFIKWLEIFGAKKDNLKARLQLYSDMDISKQTVFWSSCLGIPLKNFHKPHIKKSLLSSLTYKKSFGQGTCSVSYYNLELYEQVMMSLRYMREIA